MVTEKNIGKTVVYSRSGETTTHVGKITAIHHQTYVVSSREETVHIFERNIVKVAK